MRSSTRLCVPPRKTPLPAWPDGRPCSSHPNTMPPTPYSSQEGADRKLVEIELWHAVAHKRRSRPTCKASIKDASECSHCVGLKTILQNDVCGLTQLLKLLSLHSLLPSFLVLPHDHHLALHLVPMTKTSRFLCCFQSSFDRMTSVLSSRLQHR